jgi:hypothetical protein
LELKMSNDCILPRPDPQALYDKIKASFEATVLGGASVIPESVEYYVVANNYAMAEEFYSISAQQWAERDPRTACCDNLVKLAALDGIYPKPAGFAQGYVQITGVTGTTIPLPLQITFGSQQYRAVGTVPPILPQGGAVLQVKAIVPGPDGNNVSGTGTLASPVTGIDPTVTPYGSAFCGGSNAEECEAFRTRYLNRKANVPRATRSFIVDKIMEWPCVTRVVDRTCNCVENCGQCASCCGNESKFYVMFDNTFKCGLAPQNILDDLNNWLWGSPAGLGRGQMEVGVCGQCYTASPWMIDLNIAGCFTAAQQQAINSVLSDLLKKASPGNPFSLRNLDLAIAQIVGADTQFVISFAPLDSIGGYISKCGDLVPNCDYMPCINNINYSGAVQIFTNLA